MKKLIALMLIASTARAMQQPRQQQVPVPYTVPQPVQPQAHAVPAQQVPTTQHPFVFHKSASATLRTRAVHVADPLKVGGTSGEFTKYMKTATLETALKKDDLDQFNFFIQKEKITPEYFTELAKKAIENNSLSILTFLLSHAENIPQHLLNDLLQHADTKRSMRIRRLLVDKAVNNAAVQDVDPGSFFDTWKNLPLHMAAVKNNSNNLDTLMRLYDVNQLDGNGSSPLLLACRYEAFSLAKKFIEAGANVNAMLNDKITPLHFAADSGDAELVQLLLAKRANVKAQTNTGVTPLHIASQDGHTEIAKLLLENGANIKAQTKDGWTPLYIASGYGHIDIVKLLLAKGADVNAQGKDGWTPLHSASKYGHTEIAKLLINKDANVNAQNKDGWTSLHLASRDGRLDTVKLLLAKGADVNIQKNDGWTALHLASNAGRTEIAKYLITYKADVYAKEDNGETPLYIASKNGDIQTVKVLIENGANVNTQNKDGWTPLMIACNKGFTEIVKLLINNNADLFIENKEKQVALDIIAKSTAIDQNKQNILRTIILQASRKRPMVTTASQTEPEEPLKRARPETTALEQQSRQEIVLPPAPIAIQPSVPAVAQPPAPPTIIRLPRPTKKRAAPADLPAQTAQPTAPETAEAIPQTVEEAAVAERLLKMRTDAPDKKARKE